jgi:hypothetical protein
MLQTRACAEELARATGSSQTIEVIQRQLLAQLTEPYSYFAPPGTPAHTVEDYRPDSLPEPLY